MNNTVNLKINNNNNNNLCSKCTRPINNNDLIEIFNKDYHKLCYKDEQMIKSKKYLTENLLIKRSSLQQQQEKCIQSNFESLNLTYSSSSSSSSSSDSSSTSCSTSSSSSPTSQITSAISSIFNTLVSRSTINTPTSQLTVNEIEYDNVKNKIRLIELKSSSSLDNNNNNSSTSLQSQLINNNSNSSTNSSCGNALIEETLKSDMDTYEKHSYNLINNRLSATCIKYSNRKRSRSLPINFDIDSLLEFISSSMKINNQLNLSKKLNEIEQTLESSSSPQSILTNTYDNNNNSSVIAIIGDTQTTRPTLATTCLNTTRIDIRRARSFRDLSVNQSQQVYRLNDLIVNEKLGEGFFAIVKKITHRRTGQVMVLKELKIDSIQSQNNIQQCVTSEANQAHKSFLKEAQILRNLNHPNIIKFLGVLFTKDRRLNLILEYVNGGTLKDIIHNLNNSLPWKLRVGYAKDIAAGMEYLHSLNIIHRDLKSDNCLVRENGTVVVADFGLSRIVEDDTITNLTMVETVEPTRPPQSLLIDTQTSSLTCEEGSSIIAAAKRKLKRRVDRKQRYAVVGNSFSMAPEMLKHEIYDERVDIFSFGIICCEIIGRVQADPDYLPRTSDFGLNVELFRKKYCESDCPKHFIRIAIACCELEPEKRPPFSKTHPWLETILLHLETNNPLPKNLLKNILDQNIKKTQINT